MLCYEIAEDFALLKNGGLPAADIHTAIGNVETGHARLENQTAAGARCLTNFMGRPFLPSSGLRPNCVWISVAPRQALSLFCTEICDYSRDCLGPTAWSKQSEMSYCAPIAFGDVLQPAVDELLNRALHHDHRCRRLPLHQKRTNPSSIARIRHCAMGGRLT